MILALPCAIAGCSTAYVPSGASATSAISVLNATNTHASVAVFEDAKECYKSHVAGRMDPGKSAEVSLPAGEPVALHFQQLGFTGGSGLEIGMCNIIATFRPKSGHRYSVTMANDAAGCAIRVLDGSDSSDASVVPLVLRQFTPPQGFTNKWCPALTEQQASELR